MQCEVLSVIKCAVPSVECEVHSVKSEVLSVKCGVDVKYGVESVTRGVRSVIWEV